MPARGAFAARKRDIHLLKLEGVPLARSIGRDRPVVAEDIDDEGRPFGVEQEPRPFDEGHRAESEERLHDGGRDTGANGLPTPYGISRGCV